MAYGPRRRRFASGMHLPRNSAGAMVLQQLSHRLRRSWARRVPISPRFLIASAQTKNALRRRRNRSLVTFWPICKELLIEISTDATDKHSDAVKWRPFPFRYAVNERSTKNRIDNAQIVRKDRQCGDLIELYAGTLLIRPFKLDCVTRNLFEARCTDVTYFTVCIIIPS